MLINRFVGTSRQRLHDEATLHMDDSGYESPSAKRVRVVEVGIPPVILDLVEESYEQLYLCTRGTLQKAFDSGLPAPHRNSPDLEQAARNAVPGWGRSLTSQFLKVENYRRKGKVEYVVVNLD